MCCLFGMIDLKYNFTGKQKSKLLHILATACEARGTDATGIAYNSNGRLQVYKRPAPGHQMRFRLPDDVSVVMGHTRMTTQGDARKNFNNHPWTSRAGTTPFALAHNGVLYNDKTLRRTEHLPATNIETDSFVAVQLLQKKGVLDFDSLRYMAEKVEGSFTFTVLDHKNNLYFIKGDNPLCIYHYPRTGLYLYASTEEILKQALHQMRLVLERPERIPLECGEILKIRPGGIREKTTFNADKLLYSGWERWRLGWPYRFNFGYTPEREASRSGYIRELKAVAGYYGYDPNTIDAMLADGFSPDDIETMLYAGEL